KKHEEHSKADIDRDVHGEPIQRFLACRSHDLAPTGVKSLKSRERGKSRKRKRSKSLKRQQPERKEEHHNGYRAEPMQSSSISSRSRSRVMQRRRSSAAWMSAHGDAKREGESLPLMRNAFF